MTDSMVDYSLREGVGHIVLNRPAKRNALSLDMRTVLWEAIEQADKDDEVRAVLLSGTGEHFCAGGDISEMRPGALDAEAGRDRIAPVSKGAQRLLEMTKPVVVAVDGCAYGAGCSLALAADFVVATERARFCMSFLRLGLIPDACGLFTLPRVVGWLRAKDMLYSTRAITGSEALEYGAVNELAAPEHLQARSWEIAVAMASLPRTAFSLIKTALLRSMSADVGTMVDTEMAGQAIAYSTTYHEEAVKRLRAGSPPLYSWPVNDID
ncbi:enoyl-CoA hydratase [Pollutimonas subterranea]|uniref:Enoyl-CoA hydratase n=1 Tax=Pollutimonas subterranea TaxID=2045210 RepID=A0A2N4U934_9BURK|nr:enoyl-CoA hydratase/isomerase family protein [Pollutimonas subterranea]PLC51536.1 enoyl-CoA hydratase [Pollutimonas subterranea]